MVLIMNSASTLSKRSWKQLDTRLRQVDEDRWLSSRYAPAQTRAALVALYHLNYELARVRLVVTEPGLGAIRYQWWREALAEIATGAPRRHDVAQAIGEACTREDLPVDGLQALVDRHEAAFEAGDRSQEPEALLTAMATRVLANAHGWGEEINALAPHVAALRRGEDVGFGPVVAKAPQDIRPAVAHLRLRRLMAGSGRKGPIAKRMCVMRAVLTGRV